MTCSLARSLLDDLLDRELPVDTEISLKQHLDTCAPCRAEYESMARLKGLLGKMVCPEPQPDYWDEVTEIILARTTEAEAIVDLREDVARRRHEVSSFYRAVVSVAASLLIFATSLWLGSAGLTEIPDDAAATAATEFVPESVLSMAESSISPEEQALIAGGMLLVGSPGMFASPTYMAMMLGLDRTR